MKATSDPKLTYWQSTQASMLYFFTSVDYLQMMHRLVTDLINGVVDPLLDTAARQGRDKLLTDPQWGTRRTSENWANYGWPILKDLQIGLAVALAKRQSGIYPRPGVDEYMHGIQEFSLEWTTPKEEREFKAAIARIEEMGNWLDDTLAHETLSRWDDFTMALTRADYFEVHPHIYRYRVRMDVCADTDTVPPVAGVYVALDDPNATLQFAYPEGGGRTLRPANTFNDIGLDALNFVGRDDLWLDHQKMFAFATCKKYAAQFHDKLLINDKLEPTLARSAVIESAVKTVALKWYLVEPIGEEWMGPDQQSENGSAAVEENHRIVGGEVCRVAGFYFTPALANSRRYFNAGETTPDLAAKYGQTFWQWDPVQD